MKTTRWAWSSRSILFASSQEGTRQIRMSCSLVLAANNPPSLEKSMDSTGVAADWDAAHDRARIEVPHDHFTVVAGRGQPLAAWMQCDRTRRITMPFEHRRRSPRCRVP